MNRKKRKVMAAAAEAKTTVASADASACGSSDLGVRSLASALEKQAGVSLFVLNVTAANGWMRWAQPMDSAPDGNTSFLVNAPF